MRSSMFTRFLFTLNFVVAVLVVETATAQFGPHGRGYGGWGAHPYTMGNYQVSQQIAAQRHNLTFSIAQKQAASQQRDIRRTTSREARSRLDSASREKGKNRDWWFQQEQRKLAQRQARGTRYAASPAPVATASSFAPATARRAPTRESDDIIKWPVLLKEPPFAEQRARVEEPYRRQASEGGRPTAGDFRSMIDAAGEMKTILKGIAYEVSAGDYMAVEKFLNDLAAEAQAWEKRAAEAQAPAEPSEETTEASAGD